jgi:hypothetical protein
MGRQQRAKVRQAAAACQVSGEELRVRRRNRAEVQLQARELLSMERPCCERLRKTAKAEAGNSIGDWVYMPVCREDYYPLPSFCKPLIPITHLTSLDAG